MNAHERPGEREPELVAYRGRNRVDVVIAVQHDSVDVL
jgi:hypothetical protein